MSGQHHESKFAGQQTLCPDQSVYDGRPKVESCRWQTGGMALNSQRRESTHVEEWIGACGGRLVNGFVGHVGLC